MDIVKNMNKTKPTDSTKKKKKNKKTHRHGPKQTGLERRITSGVRSWKRRRRRRRRRTKPTAGGRLTDPKEADCGTKLRDNLHFISGAHPSYTRTLLWTLTRSNEKHGSADGGSHCCSRRRWRGCRCTGSSGSHRLHLHRSGGGILRCQHDVCSSHRERRRGGSRRSGGCFTICGCCWYLSDHLCSCGWCWRCCWSRCRENIQMKGEEK
ncbi:uncharacterized protein LOC105917470 isoform X1 [Fundulus heteroclitus]|uniref:uncharacterized protein LOC105917470 isoform X1 n=1 Tax=Fundulus heteroclitus TaxID=8078 RepID=UPI00165C2294|nr:uncharacterized protein LOC105917470 isoform X1 [Fundulus heteroclitus]